MPGIVRDEAVLGREPRIAETRVGVLDVYELAVEGGGVPPTGVADQLDITLADDYGALAYYYDHPDEMRTLREERSDVERTLADEALSPPEPVQ